MKEALPMLLNVSPVTPQDRRVAFRIHGLDACPPHLQVELEKWIEEGECGLDTEELDAAAELVAAARPHITQQVPVEVTDKEWQQLRWAATRTVDGEPRLAQLNMILAERGPVAKQTLEAAYKAVEENLIQCEVSSIIRKTSPQRVHLLWGARVFSELKTVPLPEDASLYEVINGPMAAAYRARRYDFSMSEEERETQRRSFAYGNAAIENPNVTKELVDKVAEEME